MSTVPEQHLVELAARVARRIATERESSASRPARYVLLALSGGGASLGRTLSDLGAVGSVLAVADCPTGAASAVAATLAKVPAVQIVSDAQGYDVAQLVAGATEVVAPSMDLSLASRIASMHAETPAARVVLRALLQGVPVRATLDERDFDVSPAAPAGARLAVETIVRKLRELGVSLAEMAQPVRPVALSAAAAYGAGTTHPSQERFALPASLDEFVEYLEHRPCSIEPGKPCVDCGACETRGF